MYPEGGVDGVSADGVAVGDLVVAAVSACEGGKEGEDEGGECWSRAEGRHCCCDVLLFGVLARLRRGES